MRGLVSVIAVLACIAGGALAQRPAMPGMPEPGSVLPPFVRNKISLNIEQRTKIGRLEKATKEKLAKILSEEQMAKLKEAMRQPPSPPKMPQGDPRAEGGEKPPRPPGLVIPPFAYDKLELTEDQQLEVKTMEDETEAELSAILTDSQWKKFKELLKKGPGDMPRPPGQQGLPQFQPGQPGGVPGQQGGIPGQQGGAAPGIPGQQVRPGLPGAAPRAR